MTLQLFDLAGADPARRFSPYCWRVRMALAAKGLAVETLPWRFTEGARLAAHGAEKVPLLLHGDRAIADSWTIAEYLEDRFPDGPSLFGGDGGRALARFVNAWADSVQIPGIVRLVVADIPAVLDPADVAYFRTSREARFGQTLEAVQADRVAQVEVFRRSLLPLRLMLRAQPFLGGAAPLHADSIVFGGFQWARCVSPFPLLAADDPVAAWRQRMLDLHGGLARQVPAFD
ncbi:glutathione S-transferase family protein [Falsiroseomonas selenitidurans]|uniref:Glutathione S-transferase family protein n=1 Tax=Falsiroseomonas selenitidurans TaxID=2716335 RepID=A0ABX1EFF1_9PROT|nr:glutathione S-transferase family protein [Falsiroseomonas selenitidurans]NKC34252.1 glutathione S-transferase family protein [Falsiroseomonas selenitidurans]